MYKQDSDSIRFQNLVTSIFSLISYNSFTIYDVINNLDKRRYEVRDLYNKNLYNLYKGKWDTEYSTEEENKRNEIDKWYNDEIKKIEEKFNRVLQIKKVQDIIYENYKVSARILNSDDLYFIENGNLVTSN
jgi:hypothetical protein